MSTNNRLNFGALLAAAMLGLAAPAGAVSTYSVTDLGELGPYGGLGGINNGGYVAGFSLSGGDNAAWLWSSGTGMQPIQTPGGSGGEVYGINNKNQVAGAYNTSSGAWNAFYWDSTTGMKNLGTLGGVDSEAAAINNNGQVVGWAYNATGQQRAFLWNGNSMSEIQTNTLTSYGGDSWGMGINDSNHVVGAYEVNSTSSRSFFYNGSAMTDLGTLNGTDSTIAWSINNNGIAVGVGVSANVYRAFMWDLANGIKDIGTLGGSAAMGYSINNNNQAVGSAQNASGKDRAFLYDGGFMYDLNNLAGNTGLNLNIASSINDKGQILAANWNPAPSHPPMLLKH